MKAISLWQPWASLIAWEAKRWETRSWPTGYRGPLVIHAAKSLEGLEEFSEELADCRGADGVYRPDPDDRAWHLIHVMKQLPDTVKVRRLSDFPLGCALCVVDLVDCVPTAKVIRSISSQERAFGGYLGNRFAWKLENVRCFEQSIPMRGRQQLFDCELPEGVKYADGQIALPL